MQMSSLLSETTRLIRFVFSTRLTVHPHFLNILENQAAANHRRRKDLYTLPMADLEILERLGYKQKLDEVDDAILANAKFLNQIVANPEIFGHDLSALEEQDGNDAVPVTEPRSISPGQ